ncbi:MAG: hypothetical protein K0Q68_2545 [Moraxellaceae bacterium]|jgi:hypothetical protein|nr:hypothetical protein [Moraxellaceae bacterium]
MLKPLSLLLGLSLFTSLAHAASEPRWFRYYDDKRQQVVSDSVTPEHVSRGYDELTEKMQVIRHVDAQRALTPQELAADRAKREAEQQRKRDDRQMMRLYSVPADAERSRNRQIDALQVRIDFSSSMLTTLRERRAAEAKRAAGFERTGKPVPADLKQSIASYDKQIAAAQTEIAARKAEQDKVNAEFNPIIQRLVELTGKPASAPAAAAATPAAATPAATPAASKR